MLANPLEAAPPEPPPPEPPPLVSCKVRFAEDADDDERDDDVDAVDVIADDVGAADCDAVVDVLVHDPPAPHISDSLDSGRDNNVLVEDVDDESDASDCGRDEQDDDFEDVPFDDDFFAHINAVDCDFGPLDELIGSNPASHPDERPLFYDCPDEGIRGMIDSGTKISATGHKFLLHNYRPFTAKRPCPVRLAPAVKGEDTDVRPLGDGYFHIRADTPQGYIAVYGIFHPQLRTTVINERAIKTASGIPRAMVQSENIKKNLDAGTCCIHIVHKQNRAKDVKIWGVLQNDKPYTNFLIPTYSEETKEHFGEDEAFKKVCNQTAMYYIHAYQQREMSKLCNSMDAIPPKYHKLPFHDMLHDATPVAAIRAETTRLLWHQRLGHVSDHYLYNAHKHIDGVPRFKHIDPILDTCPTCIRAKQTKEAAGPNSTQSATLPYQGLSIDFGFAGTRSADSSLAKDYVGLNGETCWVLVSDHKTQMKHGSTRISKAAPLDWLAAFLQRYSPDCPDKYVFLDQGGELFKNEKVVRLFKRFGYDVRPTGADASNQNGPVERGHLTVANAVRSLLLGANLDVKFWPHAFHHWLRIDNAIPSRDQDASPLELAGADRPDFSNFRTFGCRVWVCPPGRRRKKFVSASRKGIFLGYIPNTTRNILWYDPETNHVKIAKHARFDEDMNDLPASTRQSIIVIHLMTEHIH